MNEPLRSEARAAADQILRRYDNYEHETNITTAIRDFIITAGLSRPEDMVEESHPADGSRKFVDLRTSSALIEVKRRIGVGSGAAPDPDYVRQIDQYLVESRDSGVRLGVLTDGKRWLLRPEPGGPVSSSFPYAFTLDPEPGGAERLAFWLRDFVFLPPAGIAATPRNAERHFGPLSPHYDRDIAALKSLHAEFADVETVRVKRRLWHDLLRAALGEVVSAIPDIDDLFVRHTYLTAVVGMVVQARFGIDINALAANEPEDLLYGRYFRERMGLQGVVESDFFGWPAEVGGGAIIAAIAQRVSYFDWESAPSDIASTLYQAVIPADERRALGEYYTPEWLARAIVEEFVDDPLNQRVLDPACGSGTFIAVAAERYIARAKAAGLDPGEIFDGLYRSVIGIDVHPVAVHLARAAWTIAAQDAIADAGQDGVSVPVYLGDSLQLRYRSDDMFAEHEISIAVENGVAGNGSRNLELRFPRELVDNAAAFDGFMIDVATAIQRGQNPMFALDDHSIHQSHRPMLTETIAALQRLHVEGRNHIWAYYIRNMVRPVSLSHSKVDVVIGNPPWLNYRNTSDALREALQRHGRHTYDIWAGGRYATHQDVAGLFFALSADLYLRDGGKIGMVMPHSALQAGQYSKWRAGAWSGSSGLRTLSMNFGIKTAWDLEKLDPNDFFPVASSVVFAERLGPADKAVPLAGSIERWVGETGSDDVRRESAPITDTSAAGDSPYAALASQGASIVPRCLFFVTRTPNLAFLEAPRTITVNPRRGTHDKAPWKDLNLQGITDRTVEAANVFDVHLGETIAPYAALQPLEAVLPVRKGDYRINLDDADPYGVSMQPMGPRMRERWPIVNRIWDENKSRVNKLSLLGQIDYYRKLSSQLEWQRDPGSRPVRIVYTSAGIPTAALIEDSEAIIESKLFSVTCRDIREANYLLAVVNSNALYEAAQPFMNKGQFGARDLQKHLWKLPIPEFDASDRLHSDVALAGERAAAGAAARLNEVRAERGGSASVTIIRRELRAWLRASDEGAAVEAAVKDLLGVA